MKILQNVNILAIVTISLVLLLSTGVSNSYGQMMNQTNQTGGENTTQQAQQQLDQANQQMQQAQQQKEQAQQQLSQANQSQTNQSKSQDPKMNEKLLNYTNTAILALNEDNTSAAQDSLVQIQNALINASGKQVTIVPAPAVAPSSSSDDDGDSD